MAININCGQAKLVLLCPAWKKWGTARTVKADTVILHSRADDVVPFADSDELGRNSGATLIEVGTDHRLADPEPLAAMLKACDDATPTLKTGDAVRVVERKTAVFGLFCEYGTHEILVLIPEISWIPSFASCEQVAAVGDELEVKIIHIDRERNKVAGSLVALHPENDPWHGAWQLSVGDMLEATVVRWVEKADRCGDSGGYLLALRPAALVMLCGHEAGRFRSGETVTVRVTAELAAVDGDFIMTAAEVQPVLRALRKAGIHIVALHNHMVGEQPAFYFTHFWGNGSAEELARGLKSALDAQAGAGKHGNGD